MKSKEIGAPDLEENAGSEIRVSRIMEVMSLLFVTIVLVILTVKIILF